VLALLLSLFAQVRAPNLCPSLRRHHHTRRCRLHPGHCRLPTHPSVLTVLLAPSFSLTIVSRRPRSLSCSRPSDPARPTELLTASHHQDPLKRRSLLRSQPAPVAPPSLQREQPGPVAPPSPIDSFFIALSPTILINPFSLAGRPHFKGGREDSKICARAQGDSKISISISILALQPNKK
jgi:hypothetical protein